VSTGEEIGLVILVAALALSTAQSIRSWRVRESQPRFTSATTVRPTRMGKFLFRHRWQSAIVVAVVVAGGTWLLSRDAWIATALGLLSLLYELSPYGQILRLASTYRLQEDYRRYRAGQSDGASQA
jgi:hypothetical protein